MEIKRLGDYEYEVIDNGVKFNCGLDELIMLLQRPREEKKKNEWDEFWESEPAYPKGE